MVKKVYKYGTGMEIPEGAVYLNTKVEEVKKRLSRGGVDSATTRIVWHYFLVEVKK